MKVFTQETLGKKERLLISVNRKEIELLYGIVKKAYLHTPSIVENTKTISRLKSMRVSLGKFINNWG